MVAEELHAQPAAFADEDCAQLQPDAGLIDTPAQLPDAQAGMCVRATEGRRDGLQCLSHNGGVCFRQLREGVQHAFVYGEPQPVRRGCR